MGVGTLQNYSKRVGSEEGHFYKNNQCTWRFALCCVLCASTRENGDLGVVVVAVGYMGHLIVNSTSTSPSSNVLAGGVAWPVFDQQL